MGLIYVALCAFLLLGASVLFSQLLLHHARKKGIYPLKGQVHLTDVEALVRKKKHILAITAYRELSGSSLKDAKAFVEKLERSTLGPPGSSA